MTVIVMMCVIFLMLNPIKLSVEVFLPVMGANYARRTHQDYGYNTCKS